MEDEKTFECPRWGEITRYLFNNRGPGELALDTMIFDMPEPTLYKYILERGGLDITTEEFRQFLAFADYKKELFRCVIFNSLKNHHQDYLITNLAAEGGPHSQALEQYDASHRAGHQPKNTKSNR